MEFCDRIVLLLQIEQVLFFEEVIGFEEAEFILWQAENAGKVENEN